MAEFHSTRIPREIHAREQICTKFEVGNLTYFKTTPQVIIVPQQNALLIKIPRNYR